MFGQALIVAALPQAGHHAVSVGVVAGRMAVALDDCIDRTDGARLLRHLIEVIHNYLFMRHRDVEPGDPEDFHGSNDAARRLGQNMKGNVRVVETSCLERGVVHGGRC